MYIVYYNLPECTGITGPFDETKQANPIGQWLAYSIESILTLKFRKGCRISVPICCILASSSVTCG